MLAWAWLTWMVLLDHGTIDRLSDAIGWAVSDYDVFLADCSARATLELISDTWSVVVLVGLAHGPRRCEAGTTR